MKWEEGKEVETLLRGIYGPNARKERETCHPVLEAHGLAFSHPDIFVFNRYFEICIRFTEQPITYKCGRCHPITSSLLRKMEILGKKHLKNIVLPYMEIDDNGGKQREIFKMEL